jgi:cytoskeletal protein RodZ
VTYAPYRKIAGISLFVLGALALLWFIFIRPDAALKSAATAQADRTVAEMQTKAAEDTVKIIVEHGETVRTIHERTEVTNDEIQSAAGASQEIDPALHAAGLRALCLHNGRSEPSCAVLLQRDGGGERAGEADTTRPLAE